MGPSTSPPSYTPWQASLLEACIAGQTERVVELLAHRAGQNPNVYDTTTGESAVYGLWRHLRAEGVPSFAQQAGYERAFLGLFEAGATAKKHLPGAPSFAEESNLLLTWVLYNSTTTTAQWLPGLRDEFLAPRHTAAWNEKQHIGSRVQTPWQALNRLVADPFVNPTQEGFAQDFRDVLAAARAARTLARTTPKTVPSSKPGSRL